MSATRSSTQGGPASPPFRFCSASVATGDFLASTRQRKAPKRFDDDDKYFTPPPTKRQPKEESIVEVVAAAPVAPVIASPTPAAVKEPEVPRKRKYANCGEHQCDCLEIIRRRWIAMRNMKTTEKNETAAPKKTESEAPKKIESAKKTIALKENRAPLAAANIKTQFVMRLIGG
ncbi:unnamed protein product [Caenorhabditis brenneri]